MRIDFVTLFPEWVRSGLSHSILGRAQASGIVQFGTSNPRDYCYDRHAKVDDTPYGGEPGMLIRVEPVAMAIDALGIDSRTITTVHDPAAANFAVILTAPTGHVFKQSVAEDFARYDRLVFLCGHYEGFDHRVETQLATHVVSIGDYVLTNGELPALVMSDAVVRRLPGVLGCCKSLEADSHVRGALSAPNYTRPLEWRGESVPQVLTQGNHKAIAEWRREQALSLTQSRRPDLLAALYPEERDADVL